MKYVSAASAPAESQGPGGQSTALEAYTPEISVAAAGRQWRLTRAADLEELWDAMTADPHNFEDERLPYWTELWPSSVALAGWLAARQEEIAGRACLDLGCGLGLTALVGQWLGARVTAVDYEEAALAFRVAQRGSQWRDAAVLGAHGLAAPGGACTEHGADLGRGHHV